MDKDGKPSVRNAGVRSAMQILSLQESAEAADLRQRCREGDPFPLIAYQWPTLLVEGDDAKFFEGEVGSRENPCLRLDDWQRNEVIKPVFDQTFSEIAIKGNTRPGKGCSVAIAACLWFDCYDPCKVIVSSASHQHAMRVLFGEIAKWRRGMLESAAGRLLTNGIKDHDQHYMQVSNPATGEGFSGQHGPSTLFVFDEATQVLKERYEDAQKQARMIISIGNPRTLFGWFHDLWKPCGFAPDECQTVAIPSGRRRCVTISGLDCMNVKHSRLEKPVAPAGGIEIKGTAYKQGDSIPSYAYRLVQPLIPNQCDLSRYRAICQHADPRHVDVFAHGKFPSEDPERQVILYSWLDRHVEEWRRLKGKVNVDAFGFDVAASVDGDSSVLAAGSLQGCAALYEWKHADVVAHATKIVDIAKATYGIDLTAGVVPVCVDKIGYGKGTADKLSELGVFVVQFDGSARSEDPEYVNLRAESYAMLGRRLSPFDTMREHTWALPDDLNLIEELCAPEKMHPGGDVTRFKLRPKDEIQSSLGRSPDKADAVTMLYHVVRWCSEWSDWNNRELIASGEDLEEERRDLSDDEVDGLDDAYLRDILQTQRADQSSRDY